MSVSIEDQVRCCERELALRLKAYPRWVANGRMTQKQMDLEIERMEAVIETLKTHLQPPSQSTLNLD
jgi:hypothetical protein